ncbi:MAG: M13 family peptidase, partial [Phaeodactylibacter sp.]|nr:M13 family peptidase [Phaeodactylibacter sp.]
MIRLSEVSLAAFLFVLITACQSASPDSQTQEAPPGLNLSLMDTSANPALDFYRFANGGWLDQVEIPADRDSWGAFDDLGKQTSEKVLTILEATIEKGDFDPKTDQGKA